MKNGLLSGSFSVTAVAAILGIVCTLMSQITWQDTALILGALILLASVILYFTYCTQYRILSRDWKMFFKNDSSLHKENITNETYPKLEDLVKHPDVCCMLLTPNMRKNTHIVQISFIIMGKMDTDSQEKGIVALNKKANYRVLQILLQSMHYTNTSVNRFPVLSALPLPSLLPAHTLRPFFRKSSSHHYIYL